MLPRRNLALVGGSLLVGASLIAGCPKGASTPTTPTTPNQGGPQTSSYQPKDYFYPPSATARATYQATTSVDNPGTMADTLATSSSTVEVTSYSPTVAVLRTTDVVPDPGSGQTTTEVSTSSYRVASDGTVILDMGDAQDRYSSGVFTSAGAEVATISPDVPALRLSMVGSEAVTVPAGRFDTLKFKSTGGGFLAPVYAWYAPRTGLVRLYYTATQSIEVGSGNATSSAVATASIERVLASFTP